MIKIDYYMSHGSPWTFLGHNRLGTIVERYDAKLNILPVNYGDIFPISGGLPVTKRPPQRQKMRLQELERWSKFLKIKLIPCLLYTSPSPRDLSTSRMPSSA